MSVALALADTGFAGIDHDATAQSRRGDGPPLRYKWHEALASLRHRDYPGIAYERIEAAIAIGDAFIEYYAAQAEQFGCQPVHILRPPPHGGENAGGGLAWRWSEYTRPIGFGPRLIVTSLTAREPFHPFVHRLCRSGDVEFVYGAERLDALRAIGLVAA